MPAAAKQGIRTITAARIFNADQRIGITACGIEAATNVEIDTDCPCSASVVHHIGAIATIEQILPVKGTQDIVVVITKQRIGLIGSSDIKHARKTIGAAMPVLRNPQCQIHGDTMGGAAAAIIREKEGGICVAFDRIIAARAIEEKRAARAGTNDLSDIMASGAQQKLHLGNGGNNRAALPHGSAMRTDARTGKTIGPRDFDRNRRAFKIDQIAGAIAGIDLVAAADTASQRIIAAATE